MKARGQRTHFMGFSNRDQKITKLNATTDIFQRSFIKSRSQFHHTAQKIVNSLTQPVSNTQNITNKNYSSQLDFNRIYKESQKGHHYEFESKKLSKPTKKRSLHSNDIETLNYTVVPLNLNSKLNQNIKNIKQQFEGKDVNLFKLSQLKSTFLRNHQKRKNLQQFFKKYAQKEVQLSKSGFSKIIKQYGYDVNQSQINLMWKLNKIHEQSQNKVSENELTFGKSKQEQKLNLEQFINLMTKQNVYFKTLKFSSQNGSSQYQMGYRFKDADFQIFRNKFSKLKQAFKIYKNEEVNEDKFQKIMKKLDINDLIIKQNKRLQIFNQFSDCKGYLNVERLLGTLITQEHERIHRSGKHLKLKNYDNFQENINADAQFKFLNNEIKDPLGDKLYPLNLKNTSIVEFQKNVNAAREMCCKLKQIKEKERSDIISEICQSKNSIKRQNLYKKVQKVLKSHGYNFNKNQYKSFLAFLDFDQTNHISKDDLEKIVLYENEKERIDRLDRRKRNFKQIDLSKINNLNQQSQNNSLLQENQVQLVQKMRSKSSMNWTAMKKTYISQSNIPQFKVPTKFSAWPERLYEAEFSLIQAKSSAGMNISEANRFYKDEKHSYGLQDKIRKQRIYQNKLRKNAEWQQVQVKRLQQKSKIEEKKDLQVQYNLRLIKEKYQNQCYLNGLSH